jgi:hypothetical protein
LFLDRPFRRLRRRQFVRLDGGGRGADLILAVSPEHRHSFLAFGQSPHDVRNDGDRA